MNTILSRLLTGPFLVTIARYALAAAGAIVVGKFGLDPSQWEVVAGALLTIVVALTGGADSVTDKAVVNGQKVKLADMAPAAKAQVKEAVAKSLN